VHTYSSLIPAEDPAVRGMKNPLAVSAVTRQLSDQVYSHASEGRLVLTLGGDHSIAIGTVSGTAKAVKERLGKEIGLIWVDAHADINTPESSDSGNVHGMPVAFLAGLAREERVDVFGWLNEGTEGAGKGRVNVKNIVYIGLRDVDKGEKEILRREGIKAFSMHDIDKCVPLPFSVRWGSISWLLSQDLPFKRFHNSSLTSRLCSWTDTA